MSIPGMLKHVSERIDELALRERGLLFLVVLVVIYFVAQSLLLAPIQQQRVQLLGQLTQQRQKTQTLNLQAQAVLTASGRTPQSQQHMEALRQRLGLMNQRFSALTTGLVSPRQMLSLVRRASTHSAGVTLRSVTNMPPVPALPASAPAAADPAQSVPAPVLYRHGLKIIVTGRYPDLVRYLESLEKLPWKVFWGRMSLKVEHYPTARLTLVLYTVSRHRGWIGG